MSSPVRLGASYHPATTTPPGCRSSCARLAALTGASTVLELQRSSSIFNLRRSLSWCSRAQPPPLPHPLGTRTVHTSPHPARWAHRTRRRARRPWRRYHYRALPCGKVENWPLMLPRRRWAPPCSSAVLTGSLPHGRQREPTLGLCGACQRRQLRHLPTHPYPLLLPLHLESSHGPPVRGWM